MLITKRKSIFPLHPTEGVEASGTGMSSLGPSCPVLVEPDQPDELVDDVELESGSALPPVELLELRGTVVTPGWLGSENPVAASPPLQATVRPMRTAKLKNPGRTRLL
ncbi:hypothetical protein [Nannocystis punicea]|uniref:Uncharacterized protein n=1 Tax=Nannocystis punicea TaxID=2995304 RepID=A0ABY7GXZ0_9BACT|nr:hypothetical protein [Nannocystis poenicansa]WAS91845.1 hypothetical protein O0S08_37150 [Nannocystis poenicansa]